MIIKITIVLNKFHIIKKNHCQISLFLFKIIKEQYLYFRWQYSFKLYTWYFDTFVSILNIISIDNLQYAIKFISKNKYLYQMKQVLIFDTKSEWFN